MDMQRSMCLYISTKGTGVHRVTTTNNSTVNTVIHGKNNSYNKYGRYEPKWEIVTYTVGKVWKGISYDDDLQQGI